MHIKDFHLWDYSYIKKKNYIYHSRHTQSIKIIAEIVVNMNIVARIKFSDYLKNSSSANGYYSYTNRYGQLKRNKSVEISRIRQKTEVGEN